MILNEDHTPFISVAPTLNGSWMAVRYVWNRSFDMFDVSGMHRKYKSRAGAEQDGRAWARMAHLEFHA